MLDQIWLFFHGSYEGLCPEKCPHHGATNGRTQALCSAFEAAANGKSGRLTDLVHAAWGVYSTGGGEEDAIDSLVRIVRLAVKPLEA